MNIVTRELKHHKYILNRETKIVTIVDKDKNIHLNFDKVRMFSLIRFLVSASQKMTQQVRQSKKD